VITKEAFVREEVIVRKTVQERTETVRDTVRRTDFEREELSGADQDRG
jgi:stress response protein YsnF